MKITINEQKVLDILKTNPHLSLREIVNKLNLTGVTTASYLVNSLERKGLIDKIGQNTRKIYVVKTQTPVTYYDANLKILPDPEFVRNGTS